MIPQDTLNPWLEKLRDTKLTGREIWRISDSNWMRKRNEYTDQFHYSPFGLLLRTPKGKGAGTWRESDLSNISQYHFRGVTWAVYTNYVLTHHEKGWESYEIPPRQLEKVFGFRIKSKDDIKEWLYWIKECQRPYKTFEQIADWLESRYGNERPIVVTHSNPLLQF